MCVERRQHRARLVIQDKIISIASANGVGVCVWLLCLALFSPPSPNTNL